MAEEKMSKKQMLRELRYEALNTFTNLITAAFGLVAALAWNEAVKEVINRYIAPGSGLKSQLIYALLVTALAIIITYQLGKLVARFRIENDIEEK